MGSCIIPQNLAHNLKSAVFLFSEYITAKEKHLSYFKCILGCLSVTKECYK